MAKATKTRKLPAEPYPIVRVSWIDSTGLDQSRDIPLEDIRALRPQLTVNCGYLFLKTDDFITLIGGITAERDLADYPISIPACSVQDVVYMEAVE